MRIMFGNDSVNEFFSISATPCWRLPETTEDNPEMYAVYYFFPTCNGFEGEYLGEYKLDGTKETYRAAVKNFHEIVKQLTVDGYVLDTQFKNFEFY